MKRRRGIEEKKSSKNDEGEDDELSAKRHKPNNFVTAPSIPSPEHLKKCIFDYSNPEILERAKKYPPTRIFIRSDGVKGDFCSGKEKNIVQATCFLQFSNDKVSYTKCSCPNKPVREKNEVDEEDVITMEDEDAVEIPPLYCEHLISVLMNVHDHKETEMRDLTKVSQKLLSATKTSISKTLLHSVSTENANSLISLQNRILSNEKVKSNSSTVPVSPNQEEQKKKISPIQKLREHFIPREQIKSFLLKILRESDTDQSVTEENADYYPGCRLHCRCVCHERRYPSCGSCAAQTINIKEFSKCEAVVDKYIKLSLRFLEIEQPLNSYLILEQLFEVFFVHLRPFPFQIYNQLNNNDENSNRSNTSTNEFRMSESSRRSLRGRKRIFDKIKTLMIRMATSHPSIIPKPIKTRFRKRILRICVPPPDESKIPRSPLGNNHMRADFIFFKDSTNRSYQDQIFDVVLSALKHKYDEYPLKNVLDGDRNIQDFLEVQEIGIWRIRALLSDRRKEMSPKERLIRVRRYTEKIPMGLLFQLVIQVLTSSSDYQSVFDGKTYYKKDSIFDVFLWISIGWIDIYLHEDERKDRFKTDLISMLLDHKKDQNVLRKLAHFILPHIRINRSSSFQPSSEQVILMGKILKFGQSSIHRLFLLNRKYLQDRRVDDETEIVLGICNLMIMMSCCFDELKKRRSNDDLKKTKFPELDLNMFRLLTRYNAIQKCREFVNIFNLQEHLEEYIHKFMENQLLYGDGNSKSKVEAVLNLFRVEIKKIPKRKKKKKRKQSLRDEDEDEEDEEEDEEEEDEGENEEEEREEEEKFEEFKFRCIGHLSTLISNFEESSVSKLIEVLRVIHSSIEGMYEMRGFSSYESIDEMIFRISGFVFNNLLLAIAKKKWKIKPNHLALFFRISRRIKTEKFQVCFVLLACQAFRPDQTKKVILPSLPVGIREAYEGSAYLELTNDFLTSYLDHLMSKTKEKEYYLVKLFTSSKVIRHLPRAKCCTILSELCLHWIHTIASDLNLFSFSSESVNDPVPFLHGKNITGCMCTICAYIKNFLRQPCQVNKQIIHAVRECKINHPNVNNISNHIRRTFPSTVIGMEGFEHTHFFMFQAARRVPNKDAYVSMSTREEENHIILTKNPEFLRKQSGERSRKMLSLFARLHAKITSTLLRSSKKTEGNDEIQKSIEVVLKKLEDIMLSIVVIGVGSNVSQENEEMKIMKNSMEESVENVLKEILKFVIHCDPQRVPKTLKARLVRLSKSYMKVSYTRNILLTRLCEISQEYGEAINIQTELFLLNPSLKPYQELEEYQKQNAQFFNDGLWENAKMSILKTLNHEDNKMVAEQKKKYVQSQARPPNEIIPNAETLDILSERMELYCYVVSKSMDDSTNQNQVTLVQQLLVNTCRVIFLLYEHPHNTGHVEALRLRNLRDELLIKYFKCLRKYKISSDYVELLYPFLKDKLFDSSKFLNTDIRASYLVSEGFHNLVEEITKNGYQTIGWSLMDAIFRCILIPRGNNSRVRNQTENIRLFSDFLKNWKQVYRFGGIPSSKWESDLKGWVQGGLAGRGRPVRPRRGGQGGQGQDQIQVEIARALNVNTELHRSYVAPTSDDLEEDVIVMGESEEVFDCPILLCELTDPVKNKICGHVYSREGAELLQQQQQSGNPSICPMPGCRARMSSENLIDDHETKRKVEKKSMLEGSSGSDSDRYWASSSSSDDEDDEEEDDDEKSSESESEKLRKQQMINPPPPQTTDPTNQRMVDEDEDSDSDCIIISTTQPNRGHRASPFSGMTRMSPRESHSPPPRIQLATISRNRIIPPNFEMHDDDDDDGIDIDIDIDEEEDEEEEEEAEEVVRRIRDVFDRLSEERSSTAAGRGAGTNLGSSRSGQNLMFGTQQRISGTQSMRGRDNNPSERRRPNRVRNPTPPGVIIISSDSDD